ncbi:MAG TPA: alpha/beta-type small acid-soluble spore protein [Bacilli bacterium]
MAKGQSGRRKMVPESHQAIDQWKYEIAQELGLPVGKQALAAVQEFDAEFATELGVIPAGSISEDYWGHIAARDTGAVGGAITRRLVRQAEQAIFGL